MKNLLTIGLLALALSGCGQKPATPDNHNAAPANLQPVVPAGAVDSPIPTPVIPKDRNYNGRGKVTKINMKLGSIEIDHEEIVDLMPAMKMEFYVRDKSLLDGLKVGDEVDFVLDYKHPTETIVDIKQHR